ncbi:unnamed protein product [Rotaria sp. Silwood2]|nr:unnamed protein product [Rotaria sp. Silwood2]
MLRNLLNSLWNLFLRLNLFETHSSDVRSAPIEKLATRIYIVSLINFLIIIGIISAFIVRTENGIEYIPSNEKFIQLARKYPNTLQCRCSKVGIAYETFVKTNVDFHQVCSSKFIEQEWIDSISIEKSISLSATSDVRYYLSFFWQAIAGFCTLGKNTWMNAIARFEKSYILSPIAVREETLRSNALKDLENSISSARVALSRSLLTIRRTMTTNQFVSALETNFYLDYPPSDFYTWDHPRFFPVVFDNCSCLILTGCPHPALVNNSRGELVAVPGIIVDCYIVDSVLASTLECYYDLECFHLLHNQSIATANLLSHYSHNNSQVNSTVQALLDNFMIDRLNTETMFNSFYAQCDPAYCAYSYTHRFSYLFIVSTIIGAFGALNLILRLIAPYIAKGFFSWKNRAVSSVRSVQNEMNIPKTSKKNIHIQQVKLQQYF